MQEKKMFENWISMNLKEKAFLENELMKQGELIKRMSQDNQQMMQVLKVEEEMRQKVGILS